MYIYGPWSSGRRGLNPSHQNGAGALGPRVRRASQGVTRQNQCTHPHKILSSVLFSRVFWKPTGVAMPDLPCCGPDDAEGKE